MLVHVVKIPSTQDLVWVARLNVAVVWIHPHHFSLCNPLCTESVKGADTITVMVHYSRWFYLVVLQAVCTEAGMFALRERRVHVTQEDFEMAVAKVMKKDTEKNMSLRKLWKWVAHVSAPGLHCHVQAAEAGGCALPDFLWDSGKAFLDLGRWILTASLRSSFIIS